jgi:hypothetical protein
MNSFLRCLQTDPFAREAFRVFCSHRLASTGSRANRYLKNPIFLNLINYNGDRHLTRRSTGLAERKAEWEQK